MPDSRVRFAIFALLACNTAYFLFAGRPSEALESVAWYVLLILFTLESLRPERVRATHVLTALHAARAIATLAIAFSAVLYVQESEWLDAINLFLWIAVIVLMEIEVRRPAQIAAHRRVFVCSAATLYGALGVLVPIWLARGEWMDAWDAVLWLGAFGLLELSLLRPASFRLTMRAR